MQPHELIPWLGSLVSEIILVFFILKNKIHARFLVFFAYVIFDITRAIVLPAILYTAPLSGNYYYAYWICVPVEYILTFFIILEVFAYIFRAHIKLSRNVVYAFIGFGALLLVASLVLIFRPDIPTNTLRGMILTVNRSVSLLMAGLLFFMWAYSSRIGFTMRDHVWGIVFGLGLYSSVSLASAAVNATTTGVGPHWISALPHFTYLASTVIWNLYLFRKEPEVPPLTDEQLEEYFNLIRGYRRLIANVRKALAR
jgi:hypothetical protein